MSLFSRGIKLYDNIDVCARRQLLSRQASNFAAMLGASRQAAGVCRHWPELRDVLHVTDLRRLPLLSPAELAAACPPHSFDLLLGRGRDGLVLRSSGTSGQRKLLFHSWDFTGHVGHLGTRGIRGAVKRRPRRIANCLFPAELNGAFLFAQDVGQRLGALTFPFGSSLAQSEVAELMAEHRIDTAICGPLYAAELAAKLDPAGRAALENILYIGAPMDEASVAAIVAAVPHVTVRSLAYSTSETGPIGYQCSAVTGATHHVHEDAVVVEVVDEHSGAPVRDGETGEIVVTPLTTSGMALFRYRIGDRGFFHTEPCACGSATRLLTLTGRLSQSITIDTTTIAGDLLMARLADLGVTDPARCQLQVLWTGARYRLRLLLAPPIADALSTEQVKDILCGAYQLKRILHSSRCVDFSMKRVERSAFAQTERGKTPLFFQGAWQPVSDAH